MENIHRPPRRPYTFDRVVRILFSVCLIVLALFLLNVLKGVLLPFMVACLIAYLLEPAVMWNMRWTHSRTRFIPVALTLLEATTAVSLCAVVFIPYILQETEQMAVMVREYAASKVQIPYFSNTLHDLIRDNIDFDRISQLLSQDEWKELVRKAIASSWTFVSSGLALLIGALSWLIVVLYVIFIMLDYERIVLSFKQLVPRRHRSWAFQAANDIKNAMNRYFRGQFLIAFIVGVLFSIGFLIIGLPMGVVLGMAIGVMNLVPYLQLLSLPVTALLCLVCTASTGVPFWTIFWESMAVYIVVQVIQDMWLTPRIMGKAMGLNPAIILLSLSVWGTLLGFLGLIIALPLTTLLLSYYDQYVVQREEELNDEP